MASLGCCRGRVSLSGLSRRRRRSPHWQCRPPRRCNFNLKLRCWCITVTEASPAPFNAPPTRSRPGPLKLGLDRTFILGSISPAGGRASTGPLSEASQRGPPGESAAAPGAAFALTEAQQVPESLLVGTNVGAKRAMAAASALTVPCQEPRDRLRRS